MERTVRVFTHPACQGCGPVVKMCWEITANVPDVELRTIALETKAGLATAQLEKIRTIPTVTLMQGDTEIQRFIGSPGRAELEEAITALAAQPV